MIAGVHISIPLHTCDACGKSYSYVQGLNRHRRYRCGKEPKFECPICHNKYHRRDVLNRHLKDVHKRTDFVWTQTQKFTIEMQQY